jgi:hypothetical protein
VGWTRSGWPWVDAAGGNGGEVRGSTDRIFMSREDADAEEQRQRETRGRCGFGATLPARPEPAPQEGITER